MITETSTKNELLNAIREEFTQLQHLLESVPGNINTVPYAGSWTAAQLVNHLTKSANRMAQAMLAASKPADRNPGEKIAGLKQTFLDLSILRNAPDFIVPEDGPYELQSSVDDINHSFESLNGNADKTDLTDIVEGLPFGPVTKLELLHFVLYHTQRHLVQMKRICDAFNH